LDREDGQPLWKRNLGAHIYSSPAVAGGLVVIGADDGGVYAFEVGDGEPCWHYQTSGRVRGGITTKQGIVYVGSRDAHLYALDLRDGRLLWRFSAQKIIGCTPVVSQGLVIFGSYDGYVYGVEVRRGKKVWAHDTGDRMVSSPLVIDNLVVIGDLGGKVHGLDLHRGQRQWTYDAGGGIRSSPTESNGVIYIGSLSGDLHTIHAKTGERRWCFPTGDAVASSPAVWEGIVFFGSNDGYVYAVDGATGDELWRFATDDRVCGSPVVVDGTIYIGADDGCLYALPWHLGQWKKAAQWCETRGWVEEAASFHVLAGDYITDLTERHHHYDAALSVWRASLDPERAARLREAILDPPDQVAAEYERAAQVLSPRDQSRGAALYLRAAIFYDEAGQRDLARRCREKAARLTPLPRLQVCPINLPPFEAGIPGQITFDVRNYGKAPAHNIRVRLGGQLAKRIKFQVDTPIAAGASLEMVVKDIMPRGEDLLINLRYNNGRGLSLHTDWHFALEVKPLDADVFIGGDVGSFIFRKEEDAPVPKVRIRGSAGLVKVEAEKVKETSVDPRQSSANGFTHTDIASLRQRLAEEQNNLRLLRERKSQYIVKTDIPLELIKQEQIIQEEVNKLKRLIEDIDKLQ
jgi:outer membrane protein assembly factor BamB